MADRLEQMNRFDRVLLIRHAAICVGAVTAYVLRQELSIGYTALWIVGVSSWLNFGAYFFRTRPSLTRLCLMASPVIGVGSWAALAALTNGVSSPFVAGLWLEVILSAMALAPSGIVLVTGGAVAALWLQQWAVGISSTVAIPMVLNSGFLLAMGAATFMVNRRWTRTHELLARSHDQLGHRLEALEQQLEDDRALSSMGEGAARLAHGHKNAVHSLRGFLSLIAPKLKGSESALEGLRMAIDDLERLAFLTLNPQSPDDDGQTSRTEPSEHSSFRPVAVIERVLEEISVSHPRVHWKINDDASEAELELPVSDFTEVVRALITNAVESMTSGGDGIVTTYCSSTSFHMTVSDQGHGVAPDDAQRIFERAYTTKPQGSGYGLFLARKFIEGENGRIRARPGDSGGAVFEVELPLSSSSGESAPTNRTEANS
ncbi:HAMP domain-containing histidine kinase [Myxococcota bacterium]|nr:HAMP domain-containing histidine kinase [Myxococcota bacterium]